MKTLRDPRELAIRCLVEVERRGLLVNQVMQTLSWDLKPRDRRLARELVYGTYRYFPGIESLLQTYVKRMKKLPPLCFSLLMVSAYQLLFLRVPDYAVLHEANKLTRGLGIGGLRPMVNGVLRNIIRTGRARWEKMSSQEKMLPEWFRAHFIEQWGEEVVNSWLTGWETRPMTSFWCTTEQLPRGAQASSYLKHGYNLDGELDAGDLEHCYIQNESAQLIGALSVGLGSREVLDLCAAPGGKSCYIAAFGDVDRLVAVDQSQDRIIRMKENARRLGLTFDIMNASVQELELEKPLFDLVVLDAPCTSLGISGRHPEIKRLRKHVADQEILSRQNELMDHAWQFVKPHGFLLYAVCSVDRNEVPRPPEGARVASERLEDITPQDFPLQSDDRGFWVSPSARLDGFCGVLLVKDDPRK